MAKNHWESVKNKKGLKKWTCYFCDKNFTKSISLKEHHKSHLDEDGKFLCRHCDKKFSSYKNMKTHMRGESPFKIWILVWTFKPKSLITSKKVDFNVYKFLTKIIIKAFENCKLFIFKIVFVIFKNESFWKLFLFKLVKFGELTIWL